MEDDEWEAGLWSDESRERYVARAEQAIASLRQHVDLVAASTVENDQDRIEVSADEVRLAFVALSDAEFDYSATIGPFGLLQLDEDDDDLGEVVLDESAEHNQFSVMVRRDYAVVSEAAVLDAGRAAYLEVWPDDSADDASEDVQDLGRAIYQIIHAGDLEALNEVEGLQPTAGLMLTVAREHLISATEVESFVDDLGRHFTVDGEVLYSQSDIW